ncbi:MAG: hypothetical protein KDB86_06685 [Actinobacteria bacterium]|nr:hypothetical protein [Actinomycetota bacterium]
MDLTRLQELREKFLRVRPTLVASGQTGRWALISDGRVVSCFETEIEAVHAGHATCELGGFLVQQVLDHEPIIQPSMNVGA